MLNTHLGKAGGLNFGLESLMKLGIAPPSETFPMMFGIIDARHACDGRFWTQVRSAWLRWSWRLLMVELCHN